MGAQDPSVHAELVRASGRLCAADSVRVRPADILDLNSDGWRLDSTPVMSCADGYAQCSSFGFAWDRGFFDSQVAQDSLLKCAAASRSPARKAEDLDAAVVLKTAMMINDKTREIRGIRASAIFEKAMLINERVRTVSSSNFIQERRPSNSSDRSFSGLDVRRLLRHAISLSGGGVEAEANGAIATMSVSTVLSSTTALDGADANVDSLRVAGQEAPVQTVFAIPPLAICAEPVVDDTTLPAFACGVGPSENQAAATSSSASSAQKLSPMRIPPPPSPRSPSAAEHLSARTSVHPDPNGESMPAGKPRSPNEGRIASRKVGDRRGLRTRKAETEELSRKLEELTAELRRHNIISPATVLQDSEDTEMSIRSLKELGRSSSPRFST